MADVVCNAGVATGSGVGVHPPRQVFAVPLRFVRARAFSARAVVDPVAAPAAASSTGTGYNPVASLGTVVRPTAASATGVGTVSTPWLARVGEDYAHARGRGVALTARAVAS